MEIELNEEYKKIDLVIRKLYHVNDNGKIKFVTKADGNVYFLDKDKNVKYQKPLKELHFQPFTS